MKKSKCKKNTLYKVCFGLRNFGDDLAQQAAEITGTEYIMWRSNKGRDKRAQYYKQLIELAEV